MVDGFETSEETLFRQPLKVALAYVLKQRICTVNRLGRPHQKFEGDPENLTH